MAQLHLKSNKWLLAQQLERRWWQGYLGRKPVGEYLDWKKHYWQDFLERLDLPDSPLASGPVLDAGCGPAGIFCYLSDKIDGVVAVDPLMDAYTKSIAHFDPAWYPTVRFVASPLELFQAEPFATVFCLNAINHVSNLELAIRQLARLTSSGGYCIFSVDVHRWKVGQRFLRTIPLDALHPHQLDLNGYLNLLRSENIAVERVILVKSARLFDYQAIVCRKI